MPAPLRLDPRVATFLVALAWLVAMRAVVLLHGGLWASPAWMLASDLVGALALSALLTLCRRGVARATLLLLLGVLFYASGQHLAVHGTLPRVPHLGHAANPTLLSSSVLHLGLLLLPLYWLLAWGLHRLQLRVTIPPRPRLPDTTVAAVSVLVYAVIVPGLTAPANNPLVSVLAQAPDLLTIARTPEEPEQQPAASQPPDSPEEARFFHQRLGHPKLEQPPNVLIVMVEGLSAAYMPEVARHHDLDPAVSLPGLYDALKGRGFRIYRNVLAPQRQTNRGTYGLVCGRYPRVTTAPPKISAIATGAGRPLCLPQRLGDRGYRTAYLQAAPLEFMDKDAFMPRIGFQSVSGADRFEGPEEQEGWGAPDDVFFTEAARWLQELDHDHRPWLAVTLNVGTHHPFPAGAPDREDDPTEPGRELLPSERQAARQAAFETMRQALIGFLDEIEAAGVLDNTLLVLTSDESGGFLRQGQEPGLLDGLFGMLAVRLPEGNSHTALLPPDQVVSHLDVAVTALDAAGYSVPAGMVGRSLFAREDPVTRGLLLGDTYANRTYFLDESGDLLACNEALASCSSWQFEPGRLFGSLAPRQVSGEFLNLETRQRLVQRAATIDASPRMER
ncbi:LTA synthase family protein [Arhodomonas sp. SL1]|uniref:LTA synthase family protein n=1 Tax=Arhodomonas sp. SL1 TaxID=3425691 RepID=UPI003F881AD3